MPLKLEVSPGFFKTRDRDGTGTAPPGTKTGTGTGTAKIPGISRDPGPGTGPGLIPDLDAGKSNLVTSKSIFFLQSSSIN